VNVSSGNECCNYEDLGCTEEEFNNLSSEEKNAKLQTFLDEIPSPCYPMVDTWN